jgi:hypothetical protein
LHRITLSISASMRCICTFHSLLFCRGQDRFFRIISQYLGRVGLKCRGRKMHLTVFSIFKESSSSSLNDIIHQSLSLSLTLSLSLLTIVKLKSPYPHGWSNLPFSHPILTDMYSLSMFIKPYFIKKTESAIN